MKYNLNKATGRSHHFNWQFAPIIIIYTTAILGGYCLQLQISAIGSNLLVSAELKKPTLHPVLLFIKEGWYLCIHHHPHRHPSAKTWHTDLLKYFSAYLFIKKYHQFLWGFLNYIFHLLWFLGSAALHIRTQWNTVRPISQSIVYTERKLFSSFLAHTHRNHIYHFDPEASIELLI